MKMQSINPSNYQTQYQNNHDNKQNVSFKAKYFRIGSEFYNNGCILTNNLSHVGPIDIGAFHKKIRNNLNSKNRTIFETAIKEKCIDTLFPESYKKEAEALDELIKINRENDDELQKKLLQFALDIIKDAKEITLEAYTKAQKNFDEISAAFNAGLTETVKSLMG